MAQSQNFLAKALGFNSFYDLKKVLDDTIKSSNPMASVGIDKKLVSFLASLEHQTSFIWVMPDGGVSYKPFEEDDFIESNKAAFTQSEFKELSDYLLSHIADYENEVLESLLIENSEKIHLLVELHQTITFGLSRNPLFQIYFDKNKTITAIKMLLSYTKKGIDLALKYSDVADEFSCLSVQKDRQNNKKNQQDRLCQISFGATTREFCDAIIEGNISQIKKMLVTGTDINAVISHNPWEPKDAIEWALKFDQFEVVEYFMNYPGIHYSYDNILKRCAVEGTDQHFKIIKKLFTKTDFAHLSQWSKDNIISMAYGSAKRDGRKSHMAEYLKRKLNKI